MSSRPSEAMTGSIEDGGGRGNVGVDPTTHRNGCHCEEAVGRRGNLLWFLEYIGDCHDQCAHWSRNDTNVRNSTINRNLNWVGEGKRAKCGRSITIIFSMAVCAVVVGKAKNENRQCSPKMDMGDYLLVWSKKACNYVAAGVYCNRLYTWGIHMDGKRNVSHK